MAILIGLFGLAFAIVIGQLVGFQWVFAPLLGFVIFKWSFTTLRSMAYGGQADEPNEPQPVSLDDDRILYWCEECGTELVLTVRGTGKAPRHCGTSMHERAELLN